ncbi:hypothetical protein I6H52_06460 [Corynebacterium urealyticum]|uniref:hypothetical protein n=1 Tax=Corynebacterium urealyticum TaxID=43771 RepID=UPI000B948D96|nr:hypothetical protein [Corynebacterium urealyticum]QQB08261.1 hypothetical protein I6H53_03865 [Corynebacterium urealyticum]QQC41550.1 hypothetical protein I6H51_07495 [Corynebacterium urealyticum]QQE50174.1 hypothetical protein I6H52_06460 [Corynebacterium urealyticum]SNV84582.1 Uncharacterised protein [Corynebacterium urealyticum]
MSTPTWREDFPHTPGFCAWCGEEMPGQQRGRPRKFCSRSCRQRAYEQRASHSAADAPTVKNTQLPTLSVSGEELADQLFELRCAAEDLVTAMDEHAEPAALRNMATDLVRLAHRAEQLNHPQRPGRA